MVFVIVITIFIEMEAVARFVNHRARFVMALLLMTAYCKQLHQRMSVSMGTFFILILVKMSTITTALLVTLLV